MMENINSFVGRNNHFNVIDSLSKSVLSNSIKVKKLTRNTKIKMQKDSFTIFLE